MPRIDIPLDHGSGSPLYRQIVEVIWEGVVEGTLVTGERLPTIRQLAIDLGIHPDTVARAYAELELLGVIVRRDGDGTFVGIRTADADTLARRRRLEDICRLALTEACDMGFTLDDVLETLADLRHSLPSQARSK